GHQVHRARLRDQSGFGFTDDDEVEREKSRGSDGNAARISRYGYEGNKRRAKKPGRPSRDERSPKISAASQMRDAPLARGRAAPRARRRRSDHLHGAGLIACVPSARRQNVVAAGLWPAHFELV